MTTTHPPPPARPDTELLRKFCSTNPEHPNHSALKDIMLLWTYCGDLTETGDRRLHDRIGDEAYEHVHHTTAVCNGHIALFVQHYKHPEAQENRSSGIRFPAKWLWCIDSIEKNEGEDVFTADPETIASVLPETQSELSILPGLEYLRIDSISYWQHGRTKKRITDPAPDNLVFFRFQGGAGCVSVEPMKPKRKPRKPRQPKYQG